MQKFVLSVIGRDKPGILAQISSILYDFGCNIEDVSQTILQTEFASILIVSNLRDEPLSNIKTAIDTALEGQELSAHLRVMSPSGHVQSRQTQPFVITTKGKDQPGTIAAVTGVIAALKCNVIQFRAIITTEGSLTEMIMIFEIDVPQEVEHHRLRQEIEKSCAQYALQCSVQHRDIFENIHRI